MTSPLVIAGLDPPIHHTEFRTFLLMDARVKPAHGRVKDSENWYKLPRRQYKRSGPFQARKDRASHHPVLVALRQEAQLFGEMSDAMAVACLGERVRDVGTPMAALGTVGVE